MPQILRRSGVARSYGTSSHVEPSSLVVGFRWRPLADLPRAMPHTAFGFRIFDSIDNPSSSDEADQAPSAWRRRRSRGPPTRTDPHRSRSRPHRTDGQTAPRQRRAVRTICRRSVTRARRIDRDDPYRRRWSGRRSRGGRPDHRAGFTGRGSREPSRPSRASGSASPDDAREAPGGQITVPPDTRGGDFTLALPLARRT